MLNLSFYPSYMKRATNWQNHKMICLTFIIFDDWVIDFHKYSPLNTLWPCLFVPLSPNSAPSALFSVSLINSLKIRSLFTILHNLCLWGFSNLQVRFPVAQRIYVYGFMQYLNQTSSLSPNSTTWHSLSTSGHGAVFFWHTATVLSDRRAG